MPTIERVIFMTQSKGVNITPSNHRVSVNPLGHLINLATSCNKKAK